MSRENFVEYYTKWLRRPENKHYAEKIDAITNEGEFGKFALSQVKESGLKFTQQEMADVMEASVIKAREKAGVKIGDLAQAAEIAKEEMGAVAGGYSFSPSYSFSSVPSSRRSSLLESPTVNIYGSQASSNILKDHSRLGHAGDTIMCCW